MIELHTHTHSCMIDGTKASTILRSVGMYSELVCLKDGAAVSFLHQKSHTFDAARFHRLFVNGGDKCMAFT